MLKDSLRLFDGHLLKGAADWAKDALCVSKSCKAKKAAKEAADSAKNVKMGDNLCIKKGCKALKIAQEENQGSADATLASMTNEEKKEKIKNNASASNDITMDLIKNLGKDKLADNFLRCDSAGNCMMDD